MKVETSKTTKEVVHNLANVINVCNKYEKPKFDLTSVKCVTFPINIQISNEFWYDYTY